MKVNGSAVLHAPPDAVYAALNDPAVLLGTIPGCDSLTALGDDRYRMAVTAGVASIKGTYDGEVALTDQQPPSSFVMHAKGSGAPGTVDTTVHVTLADGGDGTTRLEYAADAAVGGMVGGVGQRMLSSVAKKMAGQFFGNVDDVLTGRRPATAADASKGAAAGTQAVAPAGVPALNGSGMGFGSAPPSRDAVSSLAAFVAGAAVALIGAAVGARLARGAGSSVVAPAGRFSLLRRG
jgi:carbon monoxide dehydrogenase subunit G